MTWNRCRPQRNPESHFFEPQCQLLKCHPLPGWYAILKSLGFAPCQGIGTVAQCASAEAGGADPPKDVHLLPLLCRAQWRPILEPPVAQANRMTHEVNAENRISTCAFLAAMFQMAWIEPANSTSSSADSGMAQSTLCKRKALACASHSATTLSRPHSSTQRKPTA